MPDPNDLANFPEDQYTGVLRRIAYLQERKDQKTGRFREEVTHIPWQFDAESSRYIARVLRRIGRKLGGKTFIRS